MIEKISEYTIDEIYIGQKTKFNVVITGNMIKEFARLSGDHNPLHTDENYSATTKFGKIICPGMFLAGFFSRLVGMNIPGKNSLYFSQSLKFISPCFINDEIIVIGEVISKSLTTKIITLKTIIQNTHGKELVKGEAKVMVRE